MATAVLAEAIESDQCSETAAPESEAALYTEMCVCDVIPLHASHTEGQLACKINRRGV
jgi:hypothetical protein